MGDFLLNGILPPLTTPFDEQGSLDLEGLRRNVERLNDTGLSGYVALGSNGEAVHLSRTERLRVVETIKRAATFEHIIIAGVNELSTAAAIESAGEVASSGADAALVITPYFYKSAMTQERLARFFTEVADHSPVPVFIYNVPQNTGVVIEPATVESLAAHQNIAGIKDSSGNMGAMSETISRVPESFTVLTGNGGILYASLSEGAKGAVLAVACVAPRATVELYRALKEGDQARARELQDRIAPLSHIVTAGLGVAGLKAALEMAGYVGGTPRSPLSRVSDSDREKIRAVMRESRLFPGMAIGHSQ